jgi:putative hemolysin
MQSAEVTGSDATEANASIRENAPGLAARAMGRGAGSDRYRLRLASTIADVRAAQSLRFQVFNLELNEGLERSFATLRDEDPFDPVYHHLLVEDAASGEVVGTYRLQTGSMAASGLGYYSAQEFDFTPFEPVRHQIVELGRACVHRSHRNLHVLSLLWRGIAEYARTHGCRYLVGCSSLTSRDPRDGAAAYMTMGPRHLVEARFRTQPVPAYACPLDELPPTPPRIPPLLRAYLSFGAQICGSPAIDREFGTIDFLTWLDLESLTIPLHRTVA